MSLTALELTAQDLKQYRPLEAIRRRKTAARADLAKRRRLANQVASQAVELLRLEFKAEKFICLVPCRAVTDSHSGQILTWLCVGFSPRVSLKP